MDILIASSKITSWDSFHDVFAQAFGFPSFYGRNMDAWIDCMSYLDDDSGNITTTQVPKHEILWIKLDEPSATFQDRCPEIYLSFIKCLAFVNERREPEKLSPVLGFKLQTKNFS